MPLNLTLLHHIGTPLTGSIVIAVYDYFLKTYFSSKEIGYDALCIFSSLLTTNLLKSVVLDNIIYMDDDSIQTKLTKIVINAILYSYLYDYFLGNLDNSNSIGLSKESEKVLISSVAYLTSVYVENPLFMIFSH